MNPVRDPLFHACVLIYSVNRFAEALGLRYWLLSGYLNDLICIGFWMPVVALLLGWLGCRRRDRLPSNAEILICFAVWAWMFEVHLPRTATFSRLTVGDPWDVIAYAIGGLVAACWWRHREQRECAGQGNRVANATRETAARESY